MSWKETTARVLKNSHLMPMYDFFGGLSEFWAAVFSVCAIILAFKGKLDSNFAATIIAINGILAAHDALDDYHTRCIREGKHEDKDNIGA